MGNAYACKKCQGTLKKEEKIYLYPFFLSGAVFDHLFIQQKQVLITLCTFVPLC